MSKNSQTYWGDQWDNEEQLSFLVHYQILMDFELENLETIQIRILLEF
jgi:hypothetical protein